MTTQLTSSILTFWASEPCQMVANRSHFSFPVSRFRCVTKAGGFHPVQSDRPLLYINRKDLSVSKRVMKSFGLNTDVICIASVEDGTKRFRELMYAMSLKTSGADSASLSADSAHACLRRTMINLRSWRQQEEIQPCIQGSMKCLHVTFQEPSQGRGA